MKSLFQVDYHINCINISRKQIHNVMNTFVFNKEHIANEGVVILITFTCARKMLKVFAGTFKQVYEMHVSFD